LVCLLCIVCQSPLLKSYNGLFPTDAFRESGTAEQGKRSRSYEDA
jgi:hypothetical protein